MRPFLLPLLVLVGCTNPVTVVGTVMSGPDAKARVVAGATVRILDDEGYLFDEAVSDRQGDFKVGAPRGASIYAVIEGEGYVPSSFTGVSGLNTRLTVERGQLFAVSETQLANWEFLYRGCPAMGEGGLVIGQVRAIELVDDATGEHPPLARAAVQTELHVASGEDPVIASGCYLTDDGTSFDAAAPFTGDTGWYAVPAMAAGLHTLVVALDIGAGAEQVSYFEVWMPEGGVAARFPTWVETPF